MIGWSIMLSQEALEVHNFIILKIPKYSSLFLNRSCMKVLAPRGSKHPYQQSHVGGEHVTALVCIRADGEVMPPMVIYKTCLPKTAYKEMGPSGAMYRATESGFINAMLYKEYITYLDTLIPGIIS